MRNVLAARGGAAGCEVRRETTTTMYGDYCPGCDVAGVGAGVGVGCGVSVAPAGCAPCCCAPGCPGWAGAGGGTAAIAALALLLSAASAAPTFGYFPSLISAASWLITGVSACTAGSCRAMIAACVLCARSTRHSPLIFFRFTAALAASGLVLWITAVSPS